MALSNREVLYKARVLITKPNAHCVERYAEDASGCEDDAVVGNPVAFCPLGAMRHVLSVPWGDTSHQYAYLSNLLANVVRDADSECDGMAEYNDQHSHREVLRVMDEAIKRAS